MALRRRCARAEAWEAGEKDLGQRSEEPLNLCHGRAACQSRENQSDLEVSRHLLEVLGGEIAAVVGIENLGDAADMPARLRLPPDRLAEGQRSLNR